MTTEFAKSFDDGLVRMVEIPTLKCQYCHIHPQLIELPTQDLVARCPKCQCQDGIVTIVQKYAAIPTKGHHKASVGEFYLFCQTCEDFEHVFVIFERVVTQLHDPTTD